MKRCPAFRRRRGFTLMEVLLVLVILVILGSLAGVAINQAHKKALVNTAHTQLGMFEEAMTWYKMDVHVYPEELRLLREVPGDAMSEYWDGPYLAKDVPLDPWGNEYQVEMGDDGESYRIWSYGPDKQDGTNDDIIKET